MVNLEQIITLAFIQGMTEFLPVSSSGHLALIHVLTPWADQGVQLDLALHGGTLFAVIFYFRRDIVAYIASPLSHATQCLLIASLPVVIAGGILLASGFANIIRMVEIIAWANLIFAIPLWLADHYMPAHRTMAHMSRMNALWIGLAQIFALIPGASRAGPTITAGRACALNRHDAARFSMLLAVPVIVLLMLANLWTLWRAPNEVMLSQAWIAMGFAAMIGLVTIHVFLKYTQNMSFLPFVFYRLALGIVLLWWL